MVRREHTRDGELCKLTITHEAGEGWRILEQRGDRIVGEWQYQDWHRVERVMRSFELAPVTTNLPN